MINELNERKIKLIKKLEELEKQPQSQAEKKGQISESLRLAEKEKQENEIIIEDTDNKIYILNSELNKTKEDTIQIRERKASSGATIEGLKKRKNDLLTKNLDLDYLEIITRKKFSFGKANEIIYIYGKN